MSFNRRSYFGFSRLIRREVHTEDQARSVYLVIGVRPSVVDVLVVRVDFEVAGKGQQTAGEKSRRGPFTVLALVRSLGGSIRAGMVGTNCDSVLGSQAIPVGPVKRARRPIEIEPVPIGD